MMRLRNHVTVKRRVEDVYYCDLCKKPFSIVKRGQ
jgi:hypothetical protein